MSRFRGRRAAAIAVGVTLALAVAGTSPATAKAAKKTTKKKAPATTARKRPTTTTKPKAGTQAAPVSNNRGTIKLGVLGTSINATTGAKTTEEARKVAQAWEATVNGAGGINGYKVEVLYKDNGGDTAKTLQVLKELEAAGVHALPGEAIFSQLQPHIGFVEQKKLPLIGGQPYFKETQTSPMSFQVSAMYNAGVFGIVDSAKRAGAQHFRKIYCTESAQCANSDPSEKLAAQQLGIKYSSQATSALKTDFTAECISAKNAGADFLQSDGAPLAPLVRDCSRQNYHPLWGNGGGAGQTLVDNLQGEQYANAIFELGVFNDFPELDGFKKLLLKTNLSTAQVTQTSLQTYMGLLMTGKIIEKLSGPNPTRADFLEATYKIKGENLDGLLPARGVDYTIQKESGKHSSLDCWTEFTILDGKSRPTNAKGQVAKTAQDNWICGSGWYTENGMPKYPDLP